MKSQVLLCCAMMILVGAASTASGQPLDLVAAAPLEDGKLYLGVGTVDTSRLPNLARIQQPAFRFGQAYVLQLTEPITPQNREALFQAGVTLSDYLPKNAFVVDLHGVAPGALADMKFVRWVGEFQNPWKLDGQLGKRAYGTTERQTLFDDGMIPVLITLFEGRAVNEAILALEALDASVHYTGQVGGNKTLSATIRLAEAAGLATLDSVQFVEEAPELTLRNSSDRWIVQSNINNVTPLYDNGIHGEGQIVGVLDGQADQQHCSLDGGKILFYNTADGNSVHGTHVSCTAVGDNGVFDNTRGVAYLANMVYNTTPSFPFTEGDILQRLNLHHSQGATVHTNSWGDDGTTSYNGLCRGFDSFLYDNEGDLVCLAVTNTGTLKNPENAKNLLAVGASQDTPNQANHCSGGVGPTTDGRRKPEIYAPGCSTTSATPSACSTTSLTGTSMACPAVTATGALVRQYYVDGYYPSGSATPADAFTPSGALIKATLLNSAVDMAGIPGYPSNSEGWGRVLADNALFFAGDTRGLVVLDDVRNVDGLSTAETPPEYFLSVTGAGQRLEITIVWTDPPASASTGTGFAAVNDLDLEVIAPDATVYQGNVFSGGVSVPGGLKDDRNNVEQVHINSPQVGFWTVRVVPAAVNQGTQGYALVATGAVVPELPAVSITLPNGAPTLIPPVTPADFDVKVTPGDENVQPGTPTLHYRYDGGSFLTSALTLVSGEDYIATLPAAACVDTPEFYISAQGDGGTTVTNPSDAPATIFSAGVGVEVITLDDDFETDQGWTVENVGLTDGAWDRGVPVGGGNRGDPADDFDGSGQCFLTDNVDGNSDVDGGPTRLISPALDLTGTVDPQLTYARWFTNDDLDADRLDVEISDDNGGTWALIESVPDTVGWVQQTVRILDFVSLTDQVKLRFSATDNPNNSLTESAIDAVKIEDFFCVDIPCRSADVNNDGDVNGGDIARFVTVLVSGGGTPVEVCAGDLENVPDGTIDMDDLDNFLTCLLAAGCP